MKRHGGGGMMIRGVALTAVLALSLLAAPRVGEAQQAVKVARIGYLTPNLAVNPQFPEAFRQGLRGLGYVESRNFVTKIRSAEGKFERLPALAAELLALKVDVIVAGGTPAALAAKQATTTLPIVFAGAGDPVTSSSPALRGRAAMSRGCPCSARI